MNKIKYFSVMYFLLFAGINITTTYGNLYFKDIGLTGKQISIILSSSALITIISQPLIGKIGTKVKNQVNLLKVIILLSGIFFGIMGLNKNFIYIVVFNLFFSFFHYSVQPILTNISLEYINETHSNYGIVRLFGTMGFCITSVAFGLYGEYDSIFLVFSIISILSLIVTFKLPRYENSSVYQKVKISLSKREKKLLLATCLLNVTFGVYFNFYGIFFTKELGGSLKLFGILSAVSTLAEIPFLLYWKKIKNNYSEEKIIIFVAIIGVIRWVLTVIIKSPVLQIFVQLLHGFGFVVVLTVATTYISKRNTLDNESNEDGLFPQTLYAMVALISSKIIGGLIGGFSGDSIGYYMSFKMLALINILVIVTLLKMNDKKNEKSFFKIKR